MTSKTMQGNSKTQMVNMPTRPIVALRPGAPMRDALHQDIRLRAFHLFQKRQANGAHGDQLSDWLRAENELRAEALLRGDAE